MLAIRSSLLFDARGVGEGDGLGDAAGLAVGVGVAVVPGGDVIVAGAMEVLGAGVVVVGAAVVAGAAGLEVGVGAGLEQPATRRIINRIETREIPVKNSFRVDRDGRVFGDDISCSF